MYIPIALAANRATTTESEINNKFGFSTEIVSSSFALAASSHDLMELCSPITETPTV
jgi:hypothetical protein